MGKCCGNTKCENEIIYINDERYCPKCGKELLTLKECQFCDTEIKPGDKFCTHCGTSVDLKFYGG